MNTFINCKEKEEKLIASFIIHKDHDVNADTLEEYVRGKIKDKGENESYSLVYIYYLIDKKVQYPRKESDVLYIGKTNGQKKGNKKSAAFRFVHLRNGQDYKQNITLREYYQQGYVIGLDIYEIENCECVEKTLRYDFLNQYGALPIADGSSYSKEKGAFVNKSTDSTIDEEDKKNLETQ